jgi:hypothetical protein
MVVEAVESKATMWTLHDAPGKEVREVPAVGAAPSVAEHHGEAADRSEPATAAADPVIRRVEAALAMRLANLVVGAGLLLGPYVLGGIADRHG